MTVHIVKEEFILGPSGSSYRELMSNVTYHIHAGDESVKVSFKELEHIGKTIAKIVERDKEKLLPEGINVLD